MQTQFEIPTELGTIRGERHQPEGLPTYATVQILHGYFSSHRVGPNRLYVKLARALCDAGFIVIRADALGVGESDGNFEQTSFYSELRDATTVHQFIAKQYPKLKHIVIGHSMGANVILRVASESPNVSLAVPVSPVFMKHGGISNILTSDQSAEITQNGFTVRKGLVVRNALLDEWEENDAVELARRVRVPIKVFQGESDQFYHPSGARDLVNAANDAQYFLVPGADHNFLGRDCCDYLCNAMRRELVSFFSEVKTPLR